MENFTKTGVGIALVVPLLLSACIDVEEVSNAIEDQMPSSPATLSGSIGDGPLVNAVVTVKDVSGAVVVSTTSDASANYSVTFDVDDNQYPLTITAANGTDLVTGSVQDFTLVAAALSRTAEIANLNPHGTVIVKAAQAMPNGLTQENLDRARTAVMQELNFGLDDALVPDPIATPITQENVSTIVKGSETLGEALRRTMQQLATDNPVSADGIIDALAADLSDSKLDGVGGAGTDGRIAGVANLVAGQVIIEALKNDLQVNGTDAEGAMDSAIQMSMPETGGAMVTNSVAATGEMLVRAQLSVQAANLLTPSQTLDQMVVALSQLREGMTPDQAAAILPPAQSAGMEPAVAAVVAGDGTASVQVNAVMRAGKVSPPPTPENHPPVIGATPATKVTAGVSYSFTPTASDPDGDALTFSITNKPGWATFDPVTGALFGTPAGTDVGITVGVTIRVSDGVSSASLPPYDLTVEQVAVPEVLTVTPEQFGAKPDGSNYHTELAKMFAYLDSKGGGRAVLSPGTGAYVYNGNIEVASKVTITGQGTLKAAGSPAFGLKLLGHYSRVESGVTMANGSKPLIVQGDHIFVDATSVDAGSYAIDVYGDYCVIGNNAKARNAGYGGLRLMATRALNRFDVGRFESINHTYKGFVYNGAGGVKEINIGTLYAVTNTTGEGSDGLLIDSGESANGTIRVGTLRVGELHVVGHRSNGFKIHHTQNIELGKVYNRNAAVGISTSTGGNIDNGNMGSVKIDSWDTDNGGKVTVLNQQIGRVNYVGSRGSWAIRLPLSGYTSSIGEVNAPSFTATTGVIRLDNAPKRLEVGKVYASVKTFGVYGACTPGTVTVQETIGYTGAPSGSSTCAVRVP